MTATSSYEEFAKKYHYGNDDVSIYKALDLILKIYEIKCKCELDAFCGGRNRKKLYNMVKNISKTHWNKLAEPEAAVRAHYEKKIKGFKLYNSRLSYEESYEIGYNDGYYSNEYISRNRNKDGYDEGYWEGQHEAACN